MDSKVKLQDQFWLSRQEAFLQQGLQHQYEKCAETGRLRNFQLVAEGAKSGFTGYFFNDTDLYKWLEASSYALANYPDWKGRHLVDEVIQLVKSAQSDDGYICTPFQLDHSGKRWKALASKHEMYAIGHLIEAGVAHFHATGETKLLDVAKGAADHVVNLFGLGKRKGYCGHPEVELAMCKLSDATENCDYRELARWMVEQRGSRPSPFEAEFDNEVSRELNTGYLQLVYPNGEYDGTYYQDDMPLAEQTDAVGHAVRSMYLYCGAIDAGCNRQVLNSLKLIWDNLVSKRMYVTGGIGSAGENEGFTRDYDLPNVEAYSETCASIGLMFWARRMFGEFGDRKYADTMELALYNAAMAGVSCDASKYFYANPLESRGQAKRKDWHGCACCPPNIARIVLSVQDYGGFWDGNELAIMIPFAATYDCGSSSVEVKSNYPWSGEVQISITGEPAKVRLRVPGWCKHFTATHGSNEVTTDQDGFILCRLTQQEPLQLSLKMEPQWIQSHAAVADNYGKVALQLGPLIYCLEEVDLGCPVHLFKPDISLAPKVLHDSSTFTPVALQVQGHVGSLGNSRELYSPYRPDELQPCLARFVPYFSWGNRGLGSMAVWLTCG